MEQDPRSQSKQRRLQELAARFGSRVGPRLRPLNPVAQSSPRDPTAAASSAPTDPDPTAAQITPTDPTAAAQSNRTDPDPTTLYRNISNIERFVDIYTPVYYPDLPAFRPGCSLLSQRLHSLARHWVTTLPCLVALVAITLIGTQTPGLANDFRGTTGSPDPEPIHTLVSPLVQCRNTFLQLAPNVVPSSPRSETNRASAYTLAAEGAQGVQRHITQYLNSSLSMGTVGGKACVVSNVLAAIKASSWPRSFTEMQVKQAKRELGGEILKIEPAMLRSEGMLDDIQTLVDRAKGTASFKHPQWSRPVDFSSVAGHDPVVEMAQGMYHRTGRAVETERSKRSELRLVMARVLAMDISQVSGRDEALEEVELLCKLTQTVGCTYQQFQRLPDGLQGIFPQ